MIYDQGPLFPSQDLSVRSYFDYSGCHVHGHPSSGGILIKRSANLVDLQLLSLPRLEAAKRSSNATKEEDEFCELMRRVGASWWEDEASLLRILHGDLYDAGRIGRHLEIEQSPDVKAASEARADKVVMFGWPADGAGVWILRYKTGSDRPDDYKKMDFALSMEERIEVMREFGAEFVEDLSQVKELHEPCSLDVVSFYTAEDYMSYYSAPPTSLGPPEFGWCLDEETSQRLIDRGRPFLYHPYMACSRRSHMASSSSLFPLG